MNLAAPHGVGVRVTITLDMNLAAPHSVVVNEMCASLVAPHNDSEDSGSVDHQLALAANLLNTALGIPRISQHVHDVWSRYEDSGVDCMQLMSFGYLTKRNLDITHGVVRLSDASGWVTDKFHVTAVSAVRELVMASVLKHGMSIELECSGVLCCFGIARVLRLDMPSAAAATWLRQALHVLYLGEN